MANFIGSFDDVMYTKAGFVLAFSANKPTYVPPHLEKDVASRGHKLETKQKAVAEDPKPTK